MLYAARVQVLKTMRLSFAPILDQTDAPAVWDARGVVAGVASLMRTADDLAALMYVGELFDR